MGILADVHDRGKGQCAFVQSLEEVGKYHDQQDAPVNHVLQPLVVGFTDFNASSIGVFGQLLVDTVMIHAISA